MMFQQVIINYDFYLFFKSKYIFQAINLHMRLKNALYLIALQQHGILEEKIPPLKDIWDQQQGYSLFLIPANR